jgi:hypothetical protein
MKKDNVVKSTIAGLLTFVGWIFVGLGVIVFMVGMATSANQQIGGTLTLLTSFFSALSCVVSGFLMVAIAQALTVFVDIALNTAPIATLVQQNAAMQAFFTYMNNKANPVSSEVVASKAAPNRPPAGERPINTGSYNGADWVEYRSGVVVATKDGHEKVFKNSVEFFEFMTPNQ